MFEAVDWGCIDYEEALRRQMGLVEGVLIERANGDVPAEQNFKQQPVHSRISSHAYPVVFCTHPPVVTLGRGSKPEDIIDWQGEIVEVSRGGRATYHGPNQLVIYPILDLNKLNVDLHHYLRTLEIAVIAALESIGVRGAEARTVKVDKDSPSLTGVWVGDKKVASIGIAIRRGVSYHGVAINMHKDASAFRGINPCGFKAEIMASAEELRSTADNLNSTHQNAPLTDADTLKFKNTFLETLAQKLVT